jgi:hypothetical protein
LLLVDDRADVGDLVQEGPGGRVIGAAERELGATHVEVHGWSGTENSPSAVGVDRILRFE